MPRLGPMVLLLVASAYYRNLPYSLMVESYYSCMRVMISRERNSAVKESGEGDKECVAWPQYHL